MLQGVEFDEWHPNNQYKKKRLTLTDLVIKYSSGLINDEDHANYIIVAFIVAIVIISIFLIINSLGGNRDVIHVLPA